MCFLKFIFSPPWQEGKIQICTPEPQLLLNRQEMFTNALTESFTGSLLDRSFPAPKFNKFLGFNNQKVLLANF